MELIVSGLDAAPIKFKHLWGRYVYGFKPWKHCIQSFVSNVAEGIDPEMKDGSIQLEDRLFYLCGVGQAHSERFDGLHPELSKRQTNVHLAVLPRLGSVAAIGSAYGVSFVIKDAWAIPIEVLPDGFQGLPEKHSRCRNFQFRYQMFNVGEVSLTPGEIVHELRERWASTPISANS